MKCQIFLCIALDHCSCFVHFQILTTFTAVVMFCVSYLLCCPFRMRFHQCFNKVGLISISMGDARVRWLNIACWWSNVHDHYPPSVHWGWIPLNIPQSAPHSHTFQGGIIWASGVHFGHSGFLFKGTQCVSHVCVSATFCWTERHQWAKTTALWAAHSVSPCRASAWNCSASVSLDCALSCPPSNSQEWLHKYP